MNVKDKIEDAVKLYGCEVVERVIYIVEISDTIRAWDLFNERKMHEHVTCLEFLYL